MNKKTKKSQAERVLLSGVDLVASPTTPQLAESGADPTVSELIHHLVRSLNVDYAHLIRFGDDNTEFLIRAEAGETTTKQPSARIRNENMPLITRCLEFGGPALVSNIRSNSNFQNGLVKGQSFASGLAVPVWQDGFLIGALAIYDSLPGKVNESNLPALSELARHLGKLHKTDDLKRTFWTETEILGLLAEVSRIMNTSLAHEDVYPKFAQQLSRFVPFEYLSFAILESGHWQVRLNPVLPQREAAEAPGASIPIVDTILPDILQRGSGVLLNVDNSDNRVSNILGVSDLEAARPRSLLVAPISWHGELIGSLNLGAMGRDAYTQNHLNIIERVVGVISSAIVNIGLHEQLQRRAEISEIVAEIGRIASSSLEPEDVMSRAADYIYRLVPFDRIDLNAIDMSTGVATRLFTSGREVPDMFVGQKMRVGEVAAKSLTRRQAIIRSVGLVYPEDGPLPYPPQLGPWEVGLVTILAAPSMARDEPVGELVLRSSKKNAYGPGDADLAMRVARLLAGLLDNARLRSQVEADSQARFICERMDNAIAGAEGIEQLLCQACDALASLRMADQIELFLHGPGLDQFPKHIAILEGQIRQAVDTNCQITADPNNMGITSLHRSSQKFSTSVSGKTDGLKIMWSDAQDHWWIGFEIELGTESIGSIWLHWVDSEIALKKFEHALSRAGQLLAEAISNLFMAEKLKTASQTASITNEIMASLAPSLSTGTLFQAFERSISSRMPVDLIAVFLIGSDLRNAPEIVHHYGFTKPFEQHRTEILQRLSDFMKEDEAREEASADDFKTGAFRSRLSFSRVHEYLAFAIGDNGVRLGLYLKFDGLAPSLPNHEWIDLQIEAWLRLISPAVEQWAPSSETGSNSRQTIIDAGIRWRTTPESEELFTPHEVKTLLKVVEGFSNEEIGQQLHLSSGTVKNRLGHIYRRLGVTSRTGAIAAAIKAGFIET